MPKKRARINPAIAVTAMLCVTALALGAQYLGHSEAWKVVAASAIFWLVGIKTGPKLPFT